MIALFEPIRRRTLVVFLGLSWGQGSVEAMQQCVVLGDSLTKEYEAEFPVLYPSNPQSWSARNWIEILHERRNAWFDLGDFDLQWPPQFLGHSHNWAFPGATTQELRDRLASTSFGDSVWQADLRRQIRDQAERVVVFAGGNDVDSYYGQLYNGGDATAALNQTRDNLKWIVDWVRGVDATVPMVLVAVPHLGFVPDVKQQHPTDAEKTGRVTIALTSMNAALAAHAQLRGIGFAGGVFDLTVRYIAEPFRLGGVEFINEANEDARTRYVFSGDGFHPNTCAHVKVAQEILRAFADRYPSPVIPMLTDREALEDVLGLDPNLAITEWLAENGVPSGEQGWQVDSDGDSIPQMVEFALEGLDPDHADVGMLPQPEQVWVSDEPWLCLTWKPRVEAEEWGVQIVARQSNGFMKDWVDVPTANVTAGGDGSLSAWLPITAGGGFLRLQVRQPHAP